MFLLMTKAHPRLSGSFLYQMNTIFVLSAEKFLGMSSTDIKSFILSAFCTCINLCR